MSQRPERLRARRESATGSGLAEKVTQRPSQAQPPRRRQRHEDW